MNEEDDEVTGKAKGGKARAAALSQEERSNIAKKAAAARWGIRATHRGNFIDDFGIDVDCYVLDDEQKTAVISQRGMAAALSLDVKTGAGLPRFIQGERIAPYVGGELGEKLSKPLIFQWSGLVANEPPSMVNGYDVTILIDLCKAVIKANDEGKLLKRQSNIVKQANVILGASAKAGIKGLVYALSGYDATREEAIAAFKFYVRTEARQWEREFQPELYREWYRLYRLPQLDKNRPLKFKHLTIEQVYRPLARSNGKILELTRAQRAKSTERYRKLHEFLSEIGVKALRTHLGQLTGIAMISEDQATYERHVQKLFGRQLPLDFRPRLQPAA
jgi:hypothetical protein